MLILLTVIHVVVCLFLIIVVLLQSGKAADIAGAFGGMGSQTTFGPRGAATILSKATTVAAGLFMVTSLSLAVLQTRDAGKGGAGDSTILDKANLKTVTPKSAPAAQPGQSAPMGQPMQIPLGVTPPAKGSVTTPATPAPAQPAPVKK